MDDKTAKILSELIDITQDIAFDVNFCLEILKQDSKVATFYNTCRQKFEKTQKIDEGKEE